MIKRPIKAVIILSALIASVFLLGRTQICRLNAEGSETEALFWKKLSDLAVACQLCPRRCTIPEGKRGFCGVRENQGGALYTKSYSKLVSLNDLDPIEKKPLFHFLPDTRTLSIATAGCNLKCKFCQNWQISQKLPEEVDYRSVTPGELVGIAKESGVPTIAYTYTEPTIFYEYMIETAKLAREAGLRNVMHSNGYINEEPLKKLAKYLDAANIDLKGITDEYYGKFTGGTVEPVLRSLKILKAEGVHLEITNLVLPGFNDAQESVRKMCLWIKDNLGPDVPVHFSRFWPMYKMNTLDPTPPETLERLREIAGECGLNYIYIGNVAGNPAESTYCPGCGEIVVKRSGYMIQEVNLKDGRCKFCSTKIAGVWE